MLSKMLAKMCLSPAIFAFFTLVITTVVSQSTQLEESKKGTELILDISDEHKAQYLNQDFYSNAYNYGYEVSPNGQFHHEVHGPDDITYGCYGYVDPFGKLKTTFYISDGWGYRVVQPGQNVELFFHEHEHHENSRSQESDNNDNHDHHGILTAWDKLHFPPICAQFEGTNTNPTVIPPSEPETVGVPGIPGKPKYPATPGTPETPSRSGYLQKSETPTILERLESSDVPTSSKTPNLPGRPGTPRKQETPSHIENFEKPGTPKTPGSSNIPGRPKTPDIPDTPSHPGFPRKPARVRIYSTQSTPEKQYYPEYPGTSETSVTPGKPFQHSYPGMSSTLVIPEKPFQHSYSGTSSTLVIPEKPSHPIQPGTPSILGRPETSITPGTSGTSYYPSYPERSRISDIPTIIGTPLHPTYPDASRTFVTQDRQNILGTPNSSGIQFRNPGTPETPGSPGTPGTPGTLPQPLYLNTTKTSNNSEKEDSPKVNTSPSSSGTSETSDTSGEEGNSGVEVVQSPVHLGTLETSSHPISRGIIVHSNVPATSAYLGAVGASNIQGISNPQNITNIPQPIQNSYITNESDYHELKTPLNPLTPDIPQPIQNSYITNESDYHELKTPLNPVTPDIPNIIYSLSKTTTSDPINLSSSSSYCSTTDNVIVTSAISKPLSSSKIFHITTGISDIPEFSGTLNIPFLPEIPDISETPGTVEQKDSFAYPSTYTHLNISENPEKRTSCQHAVAFSQTSSYSEIPKTCDKSTQTISTNPFHCIINTKHKRPTSLDLNKEKQTRKRRYNFPEILSLSGDYLQPTCSGIQWTSSIVAEHGMPSTSVTNAPGTSSSQFNILKQTEVSSTSDGSKSRGDKRSPRPLTPDISYASRRSRSASSSRKFSITKSKLVLNIPKFPRPIRTQFHPKIPDRPKRPDESEQSNVPGQHSKSEITQPPGHSATPPYCIHSITGTLEKSSSSTSSNIPETSLHSANSDKPSTLNITEQVTRTLSVIHSSTQETSSLPSTAGSFNFPSSLEITKHPKKPSREEASNSTEPYRPVQITIHRVDTKANLKRTHTSKTLPDASLSSSTTNPLAQFVIQRTFHTSRKLDFSEHIDAPKEILYNEHFRIPPYCIHNIAETPERLPSSAQSGASETFLQPGQSGTPSISAVAKTPEKLPSVAHLGTVMTSVHPVYPSTSKTQPHFQYSGTAGISNIPGKPTSSGQFVIPKIVVTPSTPQTLYFKHSGTSRTQAYSKDFNIAETSNSTGEPRRIAVKKVYSTSDREANLRGTYTSQTVSDTASSDKAGSSKYIDSSKVARIPPYCIHDITKTPERLPSSAQSDASETFLQPGESGTPSISAVAKTPEKLASVAHLGTPKTPLRPGYLGISLIPAIAEAPARIPPPTLLGTPETSSHPEYFGIMSTPAIADTPAETPSTTHLNTPETSSHPAYLGIVSTSAIANTPTRTPSPAHLGTPETSSRSGYLGVSSIPGITETPEGIPSPVHLSTPDTPSHSGYVDITSSPAIVGTPTKSPPSVPLDISGTPSHRITSDISRTESHLPYTSPPATYRFPGRPRRPSQYVRTDTSDTSDTSGHRGTSEMQPYSEYSETSETYDTSNKQDIPGYHGTSETHSYTEYHDTSYSPNRQDTSRHHDTSRTQSYSEYPVIPETTASPHKPRPLERDRTKTSSSRIGHSDHRGESKGIQHSEYPGMPERSNRPNISRYPSYPPHPSYNGSFRYPSTYPSIPGTSGRPGLFGLPEKLDGMLFGKPNYPIHVGSPSYLNGPENPVGPEGPIGGVGGDGEPGPDGPWPTGSPGPDGPWPGDPEYYSGVIHPAQSRSRGPLKILRLKSYTPINTSSSIKTGFPEQINLKSFIKTNSNVAGTISNDKLSEVSYPVKVSEVVDFDRSRFKMQEYEQIDEENINHNAKEINSLMYDTSKTSGHLKHTFSKEHTDNLEKDEITDKNIKAYGLKIERKQNNQYAVIEDNRRAEESKEDFEQFPVHRQKQYRKEFKFPANHTFASQDIIKDVLDRPYKIGHQGSRFIVRTKFDRYEENKGRENIDSPEEQTVAVIEQVNTSSEAEQTDHINATGVQPPHPINVKSFSLPLGPNPQACPCYLVESYKKNDITSSTTSTTPLIGQLGFIPVIFVPYCPGNMADSHKMKLIYPSATPVPYACNACSTSDGNVETKLLGLQLDQLDNIENLNNILNVANLGFLNVPVRAIAEKRKVRSRKVV
ncbi:mucin-5AC-like isoform X1 [Vespula squamosa]|uniref:Mucin-5AC-like isoform X1 n=1 Tax=Vespula squamosa TaxID=30214 RepID=A0ABD2C7J7_VESSQ